MNLIERMKTGEKGLFAIKGRGGFNPLRPAKGYSYIAVSRSSIFAWLGEAGSVARFTASRDA